MFGFNWYPVLDGDARAFDLMSRHYSFHIYQDRRRSDATYRNRHLIVGPGEKLVLLLADCRALFVWKKFKDASGQTGVNCAVFRNESDILSSALILEAEQLAWTKWPGERLYTYVDQNKVRTGKPATGKANPGKCYIKAGWTRLEAVTKSGKVILEKLPPQKD